MSSPSAVNKDEGAGSDAGVESLGSLMEPGDAAAASAGDLAFALRTVAEALKAQQKMQEKLCEKITERPDRARILASVKLPDFDGHPNTSVRQYREWKKDLEAIKYVNKLTDQEFALILYSSVQSRTKDLLACLELPDVRGANGLEHIWKILDDAFEQMEHERFAAAWRAWENAQRLPGQPMADWIGSLKKIKLELKEQDTTTLSDEAVASKILRCSGLPSRDQTQVLSHAGGVLASEPVEAMLTAVHPKA